MALPPKSLASTETEKRRGLALSSSMTFCTGMKSSVHIRDFRLGLAGGTQSQSKTDYSFHFVRGVRLIPRLGGACCPRAIGDTGQGGNTRIALPNWIS